MFCNLPGDNQGHAQVFGDLHPQPWSAGAACNVLHYCEFVYSASRHCSCTAD